MRYFVDVSGKSIELDVIPLPGGGYRVRSNDAREHHAEVVAARAGTWILSLAGQRLEVQPSEQEVRSAGHRFLVTAQSERERSTANSRPADASERKELLAPMPGRVVRVVCAPGDVVQKGAPLIVIEAMKMQNELYAKRDATVLAVRVTGGDTVERGAVLIELD